MADISIVIRGQNAHIIPCSKKGEIWLALNSSKLSSVNTLVIKSEFATDFAQDVIKEGLSVEF